MIKIGIAKGRGLPYSLELFENDNFIFPNEFKSGKLPIYLNHPQRFQFYTVRGNDLDLLLRKNYIDVAIGTELIFLNSINSYYNKLASLKYLPCRLSLISRQNTSLKDIKSVATRYPYLTKKLFDENHVEFKIKKCFGMQESLLFLNVCSGIVDVVETGQTIKKLDLQELLILKDIKFGIYTTKKSTNCLDKIYDILDNHVNVSIENTN